MEFRARSASLLHHRVDGALVERDADLRCLAGDEAVTGAGHLDRRHARGLAVDGETQACGGGAGGREEGDLVFAVLEPRQIGNRHEPTEVHSDLGIHA